MELYSLKGKTDLVITFTDMDPIPVATLLWESIRPQLHKLFISPDSSFLCKEWECNYFDKPWHFHKEYELVLIEKAEGSRFIGDNVSFFKEWDLILIGPNIPHLYRNSEK